MTHVMSSMCFKTQGANACSMGAVLYRSSMSADEALVAKVPQSIRVLFFLTNAPYWFMCILALSIWVREFDGKTSSTEVGLVLKGFEMSSANHYKMQQSCGITVYALFASLVAVSSTLMHISQLRLGTCCCSPTQKELFLSKESQSFSKRMV